MAKPPDNAQQPPQAAGESSGTPERAAPPRDRARKAATDSAVAIALHSERGRAQATQVVAKGSGEVAEQILQLAFDHGVKVRTDADLATILSAVEVESEIPLEALTAVANILSYIYRAEQPLPPENNS